MISEDCGLVVEAANDDFDSNRLERAVSQRPVVIRNTQPLRAVCRVEADGLVSHAILNMVMPPGQRPTVNCRLLLSAALLGLCLVNGCGLPLRNIARRVFHSSRFLW
ncbi:MAG: hypothetical protein ACI9MR_004546 [Myxococcota bacterium]|jgi:hypothetical protein